MAKRESNRWSDNKHEYVRNAHIRDNGSGSATTYRRTKGWIPGLWIQQKTENWDKRRK